MHIFDVMVSTSRHIFGMEKNDYALHTLNTQTPHNLYFVGIGGSAMSSVAVAMKNHGLQVTGSDTKLYPPMSTLLEQNNVLFFEGYNSHTIERYIDKTASNFNEHLFIIGNALSRGNPEVELILNRKLPFTSLAQFVGEKLIRSRKSVVATGTHGKTTTASLITWVFETAGKQPDFLIGGIPNNFSQGCQYSNRDTIFVTEGDEYDTAFFDKRSKFVHYRPDIAIINNIEFDHADIFNSLEDIKRSFRQLVSLVPGNGLIIANGDDERVMDIVRNSYAPVITFGCSDENTWRAHSLMPLPGGTAFQVENKKHDGSIGMDHFEIPLAGECNVRNALAAIVAADSQGIGTETIQRAFITFLGVKRRMEIIAEVHGITIIDDFAHHPTAIAATLAAVDQRFPGRRIVALFEPRSNTTTRNFFQHELASSFRHAERIIIGAIHRAERYTASEMLSAETLIQELRHSGKTASQIADPDEMVQTVLNDSRSGDVIVFLSNGTFGGAHQKLVHALRQRWNDRETHS